MFPLDLEEKIMLYCLIVPIADITGTEVYDKHIYLDIEKPVSKKEIISTIERQINHEEIYFPKELKRQAGEEYRKCIAVLEKWFPDLTYGKSFTSLNILSFEIVVLNEKHNLVFFPISPLKVMKCEQSV